MANFKHPSTPNNATPAQNDVGKTQPMTDDTELPNFETLIKGIEDIQNHCLNQHEMHLDYRSELYKFEERIEKVCQSIKALKEKNRDGEARLHGLKYQNTELKQMIAQESGLLLAAEEKRETILRTIDSEKEKHLKFVEEHEENMAKYAEKFRNAPIIYSKEKLKEQAVQEAKGLEELKAKKAVINFDIQKLQQDLKTCIDLNDVKPLRDLASELKIQIQEMDKCTYELEKQTHDDRKSLDDTLKLKQQLQAQLDQ